MDFTISNRAKGAHYEIRAVITAEKKLTDSEATDQLSQLPTRLSHRIPVNLRPKITDAPRSIIVTVRARDQQEGDILLEEIRSYVTEAIRVVKHHIQLARLTEQGDNH